MQNCDDLWVAQRFDFGAVPKQLHVELHSIDQKVPTIPCFEKPLQWYDAADYRHFRVDAKLLPLAMQPVIAPTHQYGNPLH